MAPRPLVLFVVVATLAGASCAPPSRPDPPRPTATAAGPAATPGTPAPADTAVLTQKGDGLRVGWNPRETVLDHDSVRLARFGRRVAYPVDGQVYAQPLFVPGLALAGARHNVAIVATERDSVYAFDADAAGAPPAPLWRRSLLRPGARPLSARDDLSCDAISPVVGITGTPVIDPATMTLYLVVASSEGSRAVLRVHALDVVTGRDRVPPVEVGGRVPGTGLGSAGGVQTFDARREQQRMGLLLLGGVVYAAFASYCDRSPAAGWILGYRASDLAPAVVYDDTPNGFLGGIWESGTGLGADPAGNLLFATGNGSFDLDSGGQDAGNSLVEMRPANGTLALVDYFSPFNQACLNHHDQELGSSAPLPLPGHDEVLLSGKEGRVYVTRLGHLGGHRTTPFDACGADQPRTDVDEIVQELPPDTLKGGVWGSQTAWSGGAGEIVYAAGIADHLTAWRVRDGRLVTPAASQAPETLAYPGGTPVVSSAGGDDRTAIVWLLDQAHGPALRAYDATDLGHELYTSQQDARRDGLDSYVKFSVPTVAAGRVLAGTASQLVVYGPRAGGMTRAGGQGPMALLG
jgi:hypothetical protein